jgi:serine/threonine-protein kinase
MGAVISPGLALNDRYQLTERVAAGGMGEVWRGIDRLLHREIAVKVLLPTLMSDAEFITRFRTEARMLAALRHAGIVQVYDYGENAQVGGSRIDYLVMEYVDGISISQRIDAAGGRLAVAETLGIVAQAADALQVAHEAGIVHRDVKPSNLLVRPAGAIVLVDFGVARSTTATGLTGTNVVLGSAHYMSPEQAEGKPVSGATDVYALGALAYCCLAGRPPFVGDNPLHVLGQVVYAEPQPLPADVPPAVWALVRRALDKDPARRFPSAAAMAEAARSLLKGGGSGRFTSAGGGAGRFPSAGSAPGPRQPFSPVGATRPRQTSPAAASAPRGPGGFAAGAASGPATSGFTAPYGTGAGDSPSGTYASTAATRPSKKGPRNGVLVALGVTVAIGVAAIGTALALRPDAGNANGQPSGGVGGVPAQVGGPGSGSARPAHSKHPSRAPSTTASTKAVTEPSATSASPSATTTGNPYSPRKICGAQSKVIDSQTLIGPDGTELGTVYLLFSEVTGANCTVTLKDVSLGQASPASAYLEVQGSDRVAEKGSFPYYAGPVKAKADNTCVEWGGSIDGATYDSPFEHCG